MGRNTNNFLSGNPLALVVIASLFVFAARINRAEEKTVEVSKSPIERGTDINTISIEGAQYRLVWNDEFSGLELDKNKWSHRILGYGYSGQYLTEDCAYLDGSGHLVLAMCAFPKDRVRQELKAKEQIEKLAINENENIPTTSHLRTKVDFLYGYHEIRFRLPNVPGPGLTFWFPAGKKGKGEAEIDVLEGCLYNKRETFCDYKSSTIHWYSQEARHAGGDNANSRSFQRGRRRSPEMIDDVIQNQRIELKEQEKLGARIIDRSTNGLIRVCAVQEDTRFFWDDEDWHTVALLWSDKEYVFYYDGIEVGRYDKGIRTIPMYAVLWLRHWGKLVTLSKKEDCDDPKKTPARILVDYYRVYTNGDLGKGPAPQ